MIIQFYHALQQIELKRGIIEAIIESIIESKILNRWFFLIECSINLIIDYQTDAVNLMGDPESPKVIRHPWICQLISLKNANNCKELAHSWCQHDLFVKQSVWDSSFWVKCLKSNFSFDILYLEQALFHRHCALLSTLSLINWRIL